MPTFKDQHNREWMLTLDAPKIAAVRKACNIDLAAIDGKPYEQLHDDPVLLVDVLWVLCRGQASGMTDEQFGAALVGDAIDRATEALLEAILDFSPSRKRELLRTVAAKTAKVRSVSMERALARLNDPDLEAKLLAAADRETEAAIQKVLTRFDSATSSPESSASSPKEEPSAN